MMDKAIIKKIDKDIAYLNIDTKILHSLEWLSI